MLRGKSSDLPLKNILGNKSAIKLKWIRYTVAGRWEIETAFCELKYGIGLVILL